MTRPSLEAELRGELLKRLDERVVSLRKAGFADTATGYIEATGDAIIVVRRVLRRRGRKTRSRR